MIKVIGNNVTQTHLKMHCTCLGGRSGGNAMINKTQTPFQRIVFYRTETCISTILVRNEDRMDPCLPNFFMWEYYNSGINWKNYGSSYFWTSSLCSTVTLTLWVSLSQGKLQTLYFQRSLQCWSGMWPRFCIMKTGEIGDWRHDTRLRIIQKTLLVSIWHWV